MSQSLIHRLIQKIIDWLIAFCVAGLVLWFVITQPVFHLNQSHHEQTVNIQKLKQHVQLLTDGYAPRTINYDNLNHTADYIYRQFSNIGIPEYQLINTISRQYRNVSLQLGPDTQELYVIGAHYDAEDDSIDTEGNASGVATLIELARHLAEFNNKLDIGVILIAYPLSLYQSDYAVNTGSYFHAKSLKMNNKKIRLMISLDSIGKRNAEVLSNKHPYKFMEFLYPKQNNSINLVGRLKDFNRIRLLKKDFNDSSELSLASHNLPQSFAKTDSSDHTNYWKQGYPAVLISDALYSKKSSGKNSVEIAQYKSKVGPKDRLDYEKMAHLVNGLFKVIVQTKSAGDDKTQLALRLKRKTVDSIFIE